MQVSTNALSHKADVVMSITATQKAIAEVKRLAEKRKAEGKTAPQGLRIGIRGGGCSGYSYVLEFQPKPEEGDATLEHDGVPVYLGEFKRDFLKRTVIDYTENDFEAGFKIENPNARRQCGCGESFDIDDKQKSAGA